MTRLRFTSGLFCAMVLFLTFPFSNETRTKTPAFASAETDPLEQRIDNIILENEYFAEGLVKLNMQTHGVGFTIEFLPGTRNSGPPPDPKLNSRIQNVTLKEALDWLCRLDPRYSWRRDGNVVNISPRKTLDDPNYIFNRKIHELTFVDLRNPNDALGMIFKPISNPQESVVTLASVGTLAKPWSATLVDASARHALNRLAENLGPGFGWTVFGNGETWIISFHDRLLAKAASQKQR